jgi:predicted lipoprotein
MDMDGRSSERIAGTGVGAGVRPPGLPPKGGRGLLLRGLVACVCAWSPLFAPAAPAVAADAPTIDYSLLVPALVEGFAVPASRDLTARLTDLDDAIGAVCAPGLDAAAAGTARQAFDRAFVGAVAAHGRLSALRAGALADEARAERLAFVPDSRGVVRRQVTRLVAARDPRPRPMPVPTRRPWVGGSRRRRAR